MGDMEIKKDSFIQTAPVFKEGTPTQAPRDPIMNPQTTYLCEKLGIDDPVQVVMARSGREMKKPETVNTSSNKTVNTSSNKTVNTSFVPEVVNTPMKIKMSLPTPLTPIVNDSQNISDTHESSFVSTANSSVLSNSTCSTTVEGSTPVSDTPKRTFKRRNMAMYSTDEDLSNTSNSLLIAESPRTSKVSNIL